MKKSKKENSKYDILEEKLNARELTKEELKERIDNLMSAFKVLDENDQDMFLTPFDTNILLKRYK